MQVISIPANSISKDGANVVHSRGIWQGPDVGYRFTLLINRTGLTEIL